MANGKAHRIAGVAAGGVGALVYARDQEASYAFFELLGGMLGGYVGALAPDVIEPAVHPGHRKTAHSWTVFGAATIGGAKVVNAGQTRCRSAADACRARAANMRDEGRTLLTVLWELLAILARAAAGFLAGLQGGYASHLALDAVTPRGLPAI